MSMRVSSEARTELAKEIKQGLEAIKKPEPLSLSQWSGKHFYLSSESSYVEGNWEAFPFQAGIMDCISNDDIRVIAVIKSARVGITKIMLAAIGYFAQHKRRNQAIWQPTDGDMDEFVKTEVDTMIRDVPIVRTVFPWYDKKHKNNTMSQKMFIGSALHLRGGKAAKNYRRISPDVVYLDELDGFDGDIEKEGDPVTLAAKRIEGATFPKMVLGSTPKLKESSMIGKQADSADRFFRFHIPCPHCGFEQSLFWGSPDAEFGMKWVDNDPKTAGYLCRDCSVIFTQDEYLAVWDKGRWIDDEGVYLGADNFFYDNENNIVPTPSSVAFHIWTIYSPMTEWSRIVDDFIKAKNDPAKLKGFVNLTLGEPWAEDDGNGTDASALYSRREYYDAEVPEQVNVLTIGADVQDDRIEYSVWGWSEAEESYLIDHKAIYGDLTSDTFWTKLSAMFKIPFRKADGTILDVRLVCIDSGGHFTSEVYKFSKRAGLRFVIPIKGANQMGKPVATFPKKRSKDGVYLTFVGTDTAKDLLYFRALQLEPGHGYIHFPVKEWASEDYFSQYAAETRKKVYTKGRPHFEWVCKSGVRNEAWDCAVYALAAIRILQQNFGIRLDQQHEARPAEKIIESKPVSSSGGWGKDRNLFRR